MDVQTHEEYTQSINRINGIALCIVAFCLGLFILCMRPKRS